MKSKKRIRFKKKKSRKQKGGYGDVKPFLEKTDPTGVISSIVNGFFLVKGQINATAIKRKMPKMFYEDEASNIEYYLTPRTCEMLVCTISDILSKKVDLQKLKNNEELQRVLIPDIDDYEKTFKNFGISQVTLDPCNPILSEDGRSVRLSELFKGEKGEQLTIYDENILTLFYNYFIMYALSKRKLQGGGLFDFFGSNKVSSDVVVEPELMKQYIDVIYDVDDDDDDSINGVNFVFLYNQNYDDVEGNWNRIFKKVTVFEDFYDDMVSILTFMLLKRYGNYPVEKDLTLNTLLPQDVCPGKTAKNFFKQTYRTCIWKTSQYYKERYFDKEQIRFLSLTVFNNYKNFKVILEKRNIARRVSEPVKRTSTVMRTTRRVKSVPGVDDEAHPRSELPKMKLELDRIMPGTRTSTVMRTTSYDELDAKLRGIDDDFKSRFMTTTRTIQPSERRKSSR
jgi:hypothetical protein